MRKIYKYTIEFCDLQALYMPKGAIILSTQMQGHKICIWAEIDTEEIEAQLRHIRIVGIGHEFPEGSRIYMGTVQDGSLVWHVFEEFPRMEALTP